MIADILFYLILSISFLCWGSFLNVLGIRLIQNRSLILRSSCPSCSHTIAWYDLCPIISYIVLQGRCRSCKQPISVLYPFIELLSLITFLWMFTAPLEHFWGYFIFFSALIVSVRSDFETMLLSRWVTLYFVPIGLLLAYSNALPISLLESITGAFFGYGLLTSIRFLFFAISKKDGLGEGDIDLAAMIGSFIGLIGVTNALMFGSLMGTCVGLPYLCITQKKYDTPLPFGPFLAFGAMAHVLMKAYSFDLFSL